MKIEKIKGFCDCCEKKVEQYIFKFSHKGLPTFLCPKHAEEMIKLLQCVVAEDKPKPEKSCKDCLHFGGEPNRDYSLGRVGKVMSCDFHKHNYPDYDISTKCFTPKQDAPQSALSERVERLEKGFKLVDDHIGTLFGLDEIRGKKLCAIEVKVNAVEARVGNTIGALIDCQDEIRKALSDLESELETNTL